MPDISNLLELIRKRAFLESGGGRRDPSEAIGQIFGNVGTGMTNFADARNKNVASILMGQKDAREATTSGLEQEKLRQETEPYREPVFMAPGTQGPGERPLSLFQKEKLSNIKKNETPKLPDQSLRPAIGSGYASQAFVKSVFPDLKDGEDISIGELQQRTSMFKQETAAQTTERLRREAEERAEERKPPTEAQSISATYATRMREADNILEELTDYASQSNPLTFQAQRSAPDVANPLRSTEFQQYDQAMRNFLNAVLRKESGAVISPTEFQEGRRQYFPIPGDDPEVIEQKRQNRLSVIDSFSKGAGKALTPNVAVPTQTKTSPSPKPPRIGERQGNYRFKGGDPADKKNWVPVKQ